MIDRRIARLEPVSHDRTVRADVRVDGRALVGHIVDRFELIGGEPVREPDVVLFVRLGRGGRVRPRTDCGERRRNWRRGIVLMVIVIVQVIRTDGSETIDVRLGSNWKAVRESEVGERKRGLEGLTRGWHLREI